MIFIESHLGIEPVGLTPIYQREDMAYFPMPSPKKCILFTVIRSTFSKRVDRFRGHSPEVPLLLLKEDSFRTFDKIKMDLNQLNFSDLPNPFHLADTALKTDFLLEESLLPVSKRLLLDCGGIKKGRVLTLPFLGLCLSFFIYILFFQPAIIFIPDQDGVGPEGKMKLFRYPFHLILFSAAPRGFPVFDYSSWLCGRVCQTIFDILLFCFWPFIMVLYNIRAFVKILVDGVVGSHRFGNAINKSFNSIIC